MLAFSVSSEIVTMTTQQLVHDVPGWPSGSRTRCQLWKMRKKRLESWTLPRRTTSDRRLAFSFCPRLVLCTCLYCSVFNPYNLNQRRMREDQSRPVSLVHPQGCISEELPWISEANKKGHYIRELYGPAFSSCETCKHRLVCAHAKEATLCSPHYRSMVHFHHWSLISLFSPEQTNWWITHAGARFVSPGALVPVYQKSFLSIGSSS